MKGAADNQSFPGGSKSRVNRAGDNVRMGKATPEDRKRIDEWRAAHRGVLNTFQAILRQRTRGTHITVGQRHKRKRTIFNKLRRFPDMNLARMDDVAGCRLIFESLEELAAFRAHFLKARFNQKKRNGLDKYDYIATPKDTGYRGIHDVYEYNVQSEVGRSLKGLYLEIQYRTLVQHAWATAVEVIGFITESQPKFKQGDKRYEVAMCLASEILARAHENMNGSLPHLSNEQLVSEFLELDKELGLRRTLRGLNAATKVVTGKRNAILIFHETGKLEVRGFRDATDALKELFALEEEMPDLDIVLVRADTSDEVRIAFRNYFSDAKDFLRFLDSGCLKLAPSLLPSKASATKLKRGVT